MSWGGAIILTAVTARALAEIAEFGGFLSRGSDKTLLFQRGSPRYRYRCPFPGQLNRTLSLITPSLFDGSSVYMPKRGSKR